ncbi:MAG TPA: hypothetical protein VEH76_00570 [Methylocystis sp.]|nr:hypothetical protein [Methylocystis sp.]
MMPRIFIMTARIVYYIFIAFALVFSAAFVKDSLDSGIEYWRGCASRREEVVGDEDAVRRVKSEYLVQKFLSEYPNILSSVEYLDGVGMFSGDAKGHRGGWGVERRSVGMGREIYDVSFLYQFRETAEKSGGRGGIKEVDVECSMTRCDPSPRCRYIAY